MDDSKNEGGAVQGQKLHTKSGHEGVNAHDLGTHSAIGRRLKAYYDDVASEPVPDRFLSLLDALDAAESRADEPNRE